MTKEEALQQIEEYKKPLDRSTSTFGNIVDDYYTTSEVLEITRNQIVSSLRKKGLPLAEGAKLSEVPPEILKLPTMEKKLEIVPPNPGVVIDRFDGEFDVTNIKETPGRGTPFSNLTVDNVTLNLFSLPNFAVTANANGRIYINSYDGTDFSNIFTIPSLQYACSANNGSNEVYTFEPNTPNSFKFQQTLILNSTETEIIDTHILGDIRNIVWAEVINGQVYMLYRPYTSSAYRFGVYTIGGEFIPKTELSGTNVPISVSRDDDYFYVCFGTGMLNYTSIDLTLGTCISRNFDRNYVRELIPFNDKMLGVTGTSDLYVFPRPSDVTGNVNSINALISTAYSCVVFNSEYIFTTINQAFLYHVTKGANGEYVATQVEAFSSFGQSNNTYHKMRIFEDVSKKPYLLFCKYRGMSLEGIKVEYEFDLERRV